jgi:predicted nucleotidyltransferase
VNNIFQHPDFSKACREFEVKELHAFGSIVGKSAEESQDLDLMVEFNREGYEGAFNQFMGLKERLEEIFGLPVDLISKKQFRNPLFQEIVDREKQRVYVA